MPRYSEKEPRYNPQAVGKRIKAYRVLRSMSQQELMAEVRKRAVLSQAHLAGLEMGVVKRLDMDIMLGIARALGMSIHYLLWGDESDETNENDDDAIGCPAGSVLVVSR